MASDASLRVFVGHVKRHDGDYVGRPTALGNPWSHKRETSALMRVDTVSEAIKKHADWLLSLRGEVTPQTAAIVALAERVRAGEEITLLCWCSRERRLAIEPARCHADSIAREVIRVAEETARTR